MNIIKKKFTRLTDLLFLLFLLLDSINVIEIFIVGQDILKYKALSSQDRGRLYARRTECIFLHVD